MLCSLVPSASLSSFIPLLRKSKWVTLSPTPRPPPPPPLHSSPPLPPHRHPPTSSSSSSTTTPTPFASPKPTSHKPKSLFRFPFMSTRTEVERSLNGTAVTWSWGPLYIQIIYLRDKGRLDQKPSITSGLRFEFNENGSELEVTYVNEANVERSWNDKNSVGDFLKSLGLKTHFKNFEKQKIDYLALEQLNKDDLKEMGLLIGDRKKIIASLRKN